MSFFTYIAGGFGNNIEKQVEAIQQETGVAGSAISVSNIIKLVETHEKNPKSHEDIRRILSVNRQVLMSDLL